MYMEDIDIGDFDITMSINSCAELKITVGHQPFSNRFKGIWPSKSNLLGHIYYTCSMGKPLIVYEMLLLLMNG